MTETTLEVRGLMSITCSNTPIVILCLWKVLQAPESLPCANTYAINGQDEPRGDLIIRNDLKDLRGLTEFTAKNVLATMLKHAVTGEDEKESLSGAILGDESIKVLWIFDALDEAEAANDDAFRKLLQILAHGKKMIWMKHVLLTSRPEKTTKRGNFSLFRLQGFQKEDVDTYIERYIGRLSSHDVETKLKLVRDVKALLREDSEGVFRTPLLLQFVCFWTISIGDDQQQLTKTGAGHVLLRYFKKVGLYKKTPVKAFFLKCLEKFACQPEPFTAEVLDDVPQSDEKIQQEHEILVLGLIEDKYGTQEKYQFLHASFRNFFHACWWAKQPKEDALKLVAGPELFEFKEGFYSALSLRFFCDLMKRDNLSLLLEIAAVVMDKQSARETARAKESLESAKERMMGRAFVSKATVRATVGVLDDSTREENNALCFRLTDLDLASLLGAVCDNLAGDRHLAEVRALDHFVNGRQTNFYSKPETPLMVAAWTGKLSCMKVLLDHGANPDKELERIPYKGYAALALAAMYGHEGCVRVLFDYGAPKLDEALLSATKRGNLGVVKLLMEKGANVNYETKMTTCRSPLTNAVHRGNWDVVKFLLDHGAKDANVALKEAAAYIDVDLIKKLSQETDADTRYIDERGRIALARLNENRFSFRLPSKIRRLRGSEEIRPLLQFYPRTFQTLREHTLLLWPYHPSDCVEPG